MGNYIENGYFEQGYIDDDSALGFEDFDSIARKDINFFIDNVGIDSDGISAILEHKLGADYQSEVSLFFGDDIKISSRVNGVFKTRIVSSANNLNNPSNENIGEQLIENYNFLQNVSNNILSNEGFIEAVAENVLGRIEVKFIVVGSDEAVIQSSLIYDEEKGAYVVDIDLRNLTDLITLLK